MAKKKDASLILRTCGPDGESTNGFKWPLTIGGEAICPDWIENNECGNGLHGWLYGAGDHSVGKFGAGYKWLVLEVESASIVMLGGKCKFPRAIVRFVGDMASAAKFIRDNEPRAAEVLIIGETVIAGENGAAKTGALGTATAGEDGVLCIKWYDSKKDRYRVEVAYVGENGIEPNKAYRLDDNHEFVAAS